MAKQLALSLEQRFRNRAAAAFLLGFVLILLLSAVSSQRQAAIENQKILSVKQDIVVSAFQTYLQRAEFELSTITQMLVSGALPRGQEMSVLFADHDDFLLGGVDFIYIDYSSAVPVMDPRGRLFMNAVAPTQYLPLAKLGRWQSFNAANGATFFVYKKKLVTREANHLGYLYGFVSLNHNLALTSTLLNSAGLDKVTLYAADGDLLFEEQRLSFTSTELISSLVTPVALINNERQFALQIAVQLDQQSLLWQWLSYHIVFIGIGLWGGYLCLIMLVQKIIFQPLAHMTGSLGTTTVSSFAELRDIQRVVNQRSADVAEQLRCLQLLMAGTNSAIIFCDEVAAVQRMNEEAKALFSDSRQARTLFDFMPIMSHQPIQQALKGEVGGRFELNFSQVNKIYRWQLFPYITANDLRGLALIGQDITQATQLEWQLDQLQPESYKYLHRIESALILEELNYLSTQWNNRPNFQLGFWLNALVTSLNGVVLEKQSDRVQTLGALICQEFAKIPECLSRQGILELECDLETACIQHNWSHDVNGLVGVMLLMVYASELVEEKKLTLNIVKQKLVIQVLGVGVVRPIYSRLVAALAERLGTIGPTIQGNALSVAIPYTAAHPSEIIGLPKGAVVVWIANDYIQQDKVESVLRNLGVQLYCVNSTEELFFQPKILAHIDAILVGCSRNSDDYKALLQALSGRLNRSNLPIAWVGQNDTVADELGHYALNNCPFEYNLAKLLQGLYKLPFIALGQTLVSGHHWLVVGGSGVGRAILRSELMGQHITAHLSADLTGYQAILRHQKIDVVLLLGEVDSVLVAALQKDFPASMVVLTQYSNANLATKTFVMDVPYQTENIASLVKFVNRERASERVTE
mgnify:FL=1